MAKKRGISPLGNAYDSQKAQQLATMDNIESLTKRLSSELERAGKKTNDYLIKQFGLNTIGQTIAWQLASGKSAEFSEVILSYEQLKKDTFVTFDINGRDQSFLTPESLVDLSSLEYQQFYPAVGREVNGKIDILDGSRRRAWVLLQNGLIDEFRILVTQDELSISDAKSLAKQLQTAKEHNLREVGLQCITLQKAHDNITQLEIAKRIGISQAKVSKAIKAASIDLRLIQLFPVVNDLSHTDYNVLKKVMKECRDDNALIKFLDNIQNKISNIYTDSLLNEQNRLIILELIKALNIIEAQKTDKDTHLITLVEFNSKGMFARKRVKGRNFSYEFGRLSKNIQEQLDEAIESILNRL